MTLYSGVDRIFIQETGFKEGGKFCYLYMPYIKYTEKAEYGVINATENYNNEAVYFGAYFNYRLPEGSYPYIKLLDKNKNELKGIKFDLNQDGYKYMISVNDLKALMTKNNYNLKDVQYLRLYYPVDNDEKVITPELGLRIVEKGPIIMEDLVRMNSHNSYEYNKDSMGNYLVKDRVSKVVVPVVADYIDTSIPAVVKIGDDEVGWFQATAYTDDASLVNGWKQIDATNWQWTGIIDFGPNWKDMANKGYDVRIEAQDLAGNVGTATDKIIYDTKPPGLELELGDAISISNLIHFSPEKEIVKVRASDNISDVIELEVAFKDDTGKKVMDWVLKYDWQNKKFVSGMTNGIVIKSDGSLGVNWGGLSDLLGAGFQGGIHIDVILKDEAGNVARNTALSFKVGMPPWVGKALGILAKVKDFASRVMIVSSGFSLGGTEWEFVKKELFSVGVDIRQVSLDNGEKWGSIDKQVEKLKAAMDDFSRGENEKDTNNYSGLLFLLLIGSISIGNIKRRNGILLLIGVILMVGLTNCAKRMIKEESLKIDVEKVKVENIQAKEIIFTSWGTNRGQIRTNLPKNMVEKYKKSGRILPDDTNVRFSVRSIKVNDNDRYIYIEQNWLDTILVYSSDGKLYNKIWYSKKDNFFGVDWDIDEEGNIYVASPQKGESGFSDDDPLCYAAMRIFNRKGELLKVVKLPKDKKIYNAIKVKNGFVYNGHLEKIYDYRKLLKHPEKKSKKNKIPFFLREMVNEIEWVKTLKDGSDIYKFNPVQFEKYDGIKLEFDSYIIRFPVKFHSIYCLGQDEKKNIYFVLSNYNRRYNSDIDMVYIVKLNKRGHITNLFSVHVGKDDIGLEDLYFDIDYKGNIYQIRTDDKGMHILKYKTE